MLETAASMSRGAGRRCGRAGLCGAGSAAGRHRPAAQAQDRAGQLCADGADGAELQPHAAGFAAQRLQQAPLEAKLRGSRKRKKDSQEWSSAPSYLLLEQVLEELRPGQQEACELVGLERQLANRETARALLGPRASQELVFHAGCICRAWTGGEPLASALHARRADLVAPG
jgi:hypothetical protein